MKGSIMRFFLFSMLIVLVSCKSVEQSEVQAVIGIDSQQAAYTFHDDKNGRYAVTNLRAGIFDFRYLVVSQFNPSGDPKGYDEAKATCDSLNWLGTKWSLPSTSQARFLLHNGFRSQNDPKFTAKQNRSADKIGRIWVVPENKGSHAPASAENQLITASLQLDAKVTELEGGNNTNTSYLDHNRQSLSFVDAESAIQALPKTSKENFVCTAYITRGEQNLNNPQEDDFPWVSPYYRQELQAHLFLNKQLKEQDQRTYRYLKDLQSLDNARYDSQQAFHKMSLQRRQRAQGIPESEQITSTQQIEFEQDYESAVAKENHLNGQLKQRMSSYSNDELKKVYDAFVRFLTLRGQSFESIEKDHQIRAEKRKYVFENQVILQHMRSIENNLGLK